MMHVEPILLTVRWYNDGESFEQKSPYAAIATIQILNSDTAFISGLHGTVTRKRVYELAKWFKEHKISYVFSTRKGEWKKYDVEYFFKLKRIYGG